MASAIWAKAQRFQERLTRLDNQPVGRAALSIILFLDFFILMSIFNGLAQHTAQLTSPDEHIPALCRDVVLDAQWNPTNRLEQLAQMVSQYRGSYVLPDERADREPVHAVCAPLMQAYFAIRDDKEVSRNLGDLLTLQKETRDLRTELERLKGSYDTALLEAIASKEQMERQVASVKQQITEKTDAMNEMVRRQRLLTETVEQNQRVSTFYGVVAGVSESDRTALRDDLRRMNFWYPVKRLGMEMLFLLPLFLVFYAWNARSITRNRPFQALVSSHLLVVAMIPAIFKLIELVYDILPRKLLRQVFELLESFKLVAIWHYLLIAAAVLGALALIVLFQRKLFSHEKLMQRRIAKGQCQHCGLRLPEGNHYCTACGGDQYRTCASCQELTPVYGKYCRACGKPL
jgi:pyrimidine operon attenuation protein/uracil phosphoribosyltransferase